MRNRSRDRRVVDVPEDPRQAAERLMNETGLPRNMAVAVAQGRLTKDEALQRLSRRADVEQLMRDHDLSRALATQVVLGHADLASYLAKRRFEAHRDENLQRSVLDEALADGEPRTFVVTGGGKRTARVVSNAAFEVVLQDDGAEAEEVHKLTLLYAYRPDAWKRVRKVLKRERDLAKAGHKPAERPQDRYTVSDKRLFRYVDEGVSVDATTLEGDVLRGEVTWFSRYEFGLRIKGDEEVIVFRHALHHLGEAS